MTSPRRAALFACLLALSAGGLTACGSSDSSGIASGSAPDVLKQTFGHAQPIKSGKLDGALDLNLQGLQGLSGPIALKLAGPFQSQGGKTLPAFDFELTFGAGGTSFTAGAVSTGEKGYLKLQDRVYDVGKPIYDAFKNGYAKASKDTGKGGASFKTLGVDPLRWLRNAKKAGEDQVGGTDTVHITATIDVAKFLADVNTLLGKAGQLGVTGAAAKDLPTAISAKQRQAIVRSVKVATFDVYTGKADGIMRRVVVKLSFDVPADARKDAGGLTRGTAALDLKLNEINKGQTISAPKGARPFSELTAQLSGLFGGGSSPLGGGGSSSSSGSGSSGSSGSGSSSGAASSSRYMSCLQTAGQDIAKVQECASLLGK